MNSHDAAFQMGKVVPGKAWPEIIDLATPPDVQRQIVATP